MKKIILFLCISCIGLQYSYCQNADTVNVSNPFSEIAYHINRAGVITGTSGILLSASIVIGIVGITSSSNTLMRKVPLYLSSACLIGVVTCLFIIADNLKKAGLKLHRLDFKDNALIIKLN